MDLLTPFDESLTNLGDFSIDCMENTIDLLIDNDIVDAIPITKAIKSIIGVGVAIRERNLIRNTLNFLNSVKQGNLTKEQLDKYKKKLNDDKKYKKELERVLIIVDKQIDCEKSYLLGKIFNALISETITYDEFIDYTDLLEKMFIGDVKLLLQRYDEIKDGKGIIIVPKEDMRVFKRLASNGIGEIIFGDNKEESEGKYKFYYDEYGYKIISILAGDYDVKVLSETEFEDIHVNHSGIKVTVLDDTLSFGKR